MNSIKKIALVIIVGSIVIGSAFGLITTSNSTTNHQISIDASVITTKVPTTCGSIPANFSNWVQLHVKANQTDLQLVSLIVVTPPPSISLTMPLNQSSSAYVYYHRFNSTQEDVSVPMPDYWKPGQDVYLSVNYYYNGPNPTAETVYTIGARAVNSTTLSC